MCVLFGCSPDELSYPWTEIQSHHSIVLMRADRRENYLHELFDSSKKTMRTRRR